MSSAKSLSLSDLGGEIFPELSRQSSHKTKQDKTKDGPLLAAQMFTISSSLVSGVSIPKFAI